MPGTKSSDMRDKNDVPGRHYATGHVKFHPPQNFPKIQFNFNYLRI